MYKKKCSAIARSNEAKKRKKESFGKLLDTRAGLNKAAGPQYVGERGGLRPVAGPGTGNASEDECQSMGQLLRFGSRIL